MNKLAILLVASCIFAVAFADCTISATTTGCLTCDGTTPANCGTCNPGYTLTSPASGVCQACTVTNCATCAVQATCTACSTGYTLASNVCTATSTTSSSVLAVSALAAFALLI